MFMFLAVPGLSWGTQDLWSSSCHARHFSCSMWDLVLLSGIEPWPPALGAQSLSHWGTREVPPKVLFEICLCAKSLQSCLTLCDPMDCSPPGSSVHGVLQARILEWVSMPYSRGPSRLRDQTWVSCIAGRFFTTEQPGKPCSIKWDNNAMVA